MAALSYDPRHHLQAGKTSHGVIVEEIEGLIKVYKGGRVERPPIVPNVSCVLAPEDGVTARDVFIDKFTNLWARVYVPSHPGSRLPLLVYFHGGGFCAGSPAWSCYQNFLVNLASKSGCIILSVNYRLAPENRLPSAYDDGTNTLMWIKQQALLGPSEHKWWLSKCNFSSLFLAGDSAGANIAYNVASNVNSDSSLRPFYLRGIILIQPFFGGEARTYSERNLNQPANSALTLSASDAYWRLSLPIGANRDNPYCNPLANGAKKLRDFQVPSIMVCISEMDIMKDRNLEFCSALSSAGKKVEKVIYKGVGHAFQILHNSHFSQIRIQEMMSHLKGFINQ
ncbi:probable carboxylesterase 17 [Mercurialis annua]|uniref:probable carboxylesterase 17 n=1 Tax=Mercurialis annua TaxID=3986 RepID=UPI002160764D|nr:probable carboxylesterase 17 [Mercurialis annua]